jgi:ferrochelatase
MSLGVILFNLGGPETLADVRPFLYNLFSDPEIIRLPARFMQKPLAWLIATTRAKKSSAYYAQIGGGSPLRRITDEQAKALQTELHGRGIEAKVYVGMRYWHPFTNEALHRIERDGITELVVLPLYPQFSVSTTGSSLKEFIALLRERSKWRNIRRRYITRWFDYEPYIQALAEQIKTELAQFPDPANVHLLFSAHSVPQSYIERGDPYLRHTEETVRLVSAALGNDYPTHLSFQSKVGPVKWLEPATEQMIRDLHAQDVEQLLMIPISFVSEHIETLYELDILYKQVAEEIGLTQYRRVPAFNTDPRFIRALADLVSSKIQS